MQRRANSPKLLARILRRCSFTRRLRLSRLIVQRTRHQEENWQYVQSVLIGVGNLIRTWSFIERQLNTLICNYHPIASDKVREHGLPMSLERKIKYLIILSKDERLPITLRDAIRVWVPDLNRLRHHRHWIVHGNLSQVGRTQKWRAQLLTLKGNGPTFEDRYFDSAELLERQREIHDLSHRMAQVINPLLFGENWRIAPRR